MNIATAATIAQLTSGFELESRRLLEAVRILRKETAMGLWDAKVFLEQFDTDGLTTAQLHIKLFEKLCDDFVQSPEDLLFIKKDQLHRLIDEIDELERTISAQRLHADALEAFEADKNA